MGPNRIIAVILFIAASLGLASCVVYVNDETPAGRAAAANCVSPGYMYSSSTTTIIPGSPAGVNTGSQQATPVTRKITINYTTLVPGSNGYVFFDGNNNKIAEWIFQPDGRIQKKGQAISGLVKIFYDAVNVAAEINYRNNKREGSFIEYYRTGRIKTHGNYKGGKRFGSWKQFLPDGGVEQDAFYKTGKNADIYFQAKTVPAYNYEEHWKAVEIEDSPPFGGLYLKPPSSGGLCDGVMTMPSANPLPRPRLFRKQFIPAMKIAGRQPARLSRRPPRLIL